MKDHAKAIKLAPAISDVLFSDEQAVRDQAGNIFPIRSMAGGACRGVDIADYRFVTQNPTKGSHYAQMACQGHKIIWVIYRPTNLWVARVTDGQTEKL